MITNIRGKIVFTIIQIYVHIMIIYNFQHGSLPRRFPSDWSKQFIAAVLLLLFLSLLILFINSVNIRKGLFFVRMFFLIMVSIPFIGNSDLGNFSLLFSLHAFEGFLYFTNKIAFGIGFFNIVILFLLANHRITLWDYYNPKHSAKILTFVITAFHCVLGGAVGYILANEDRLRCKEKKLLEELQTTNRCLAEANIGLQNVAVQAELASVLKERTRIAREIHDSIAYMFTNLIALLNTYLVRRQSNGIKTPNEVEKARNLAVEGLRELRQALRTLRPGENENYNGLGSVLRLTKVFKQATGIDVTLNFGDVPQFIGETLENVIYRVIQEGLTNSFRHGKATEVLISFYLVNCGLEVIIKDNGCGTATPTGGYGLVGINERVTELDGTVKIATKPGCGFTLQIWLPLPREA